MRHGSLLCFKTNLHLPLFFFLEHPFPDINERDGAFWTSLPRGRARTCPVCTCCVDDLDPGIDELGRGGPVVGVLGEEEGFAEEAGRAQLGRWVRCCLAAALALAPSVLAASNSTAKCVSRYYLNHRLLVSPNRYSDPFRSMLALQDNMARPEHHIVGPCPANETPIHRLPGRRTRK